MVGMKEMSYLQVRMKSREPIVCVCSFVDFSLYSAVSIQEQGSYCFCNASHGVSAAAVRWIET